MVLYRKDSTTLLMIVKKKYLRLIFLVFIASKSYGDETSFLEACRSEVYDRLVQEDKVITAIRVNLSQSAPQECLAKYKKLKRFIAIESIDYFQKSMGDEQYRDSIDASVDEMTGDMPSLILYSNISRNNHHASRDHNKNATRIKAVKGYTILNGSK